MITDVEVEDFQAIRKASIRLGRFTVVTGPTGSGKSGLIRAMRLVAFNARGTSYIRHGAKKCAAMLGFRGDGYVVAIHRGGRGADKYVVGEINQDMARHTNDPVLREYTKLEGKVPADISQLLGLGEINFAGQFDRPYLLTESGSQVARVLGELTNVTLVFDAAREANRRKLETARDLRAAETLLKDLTEQAKGFRGLKARIEAGVDARAAVDRMTELGERYGRLRNLAETHRALEHQWAAAQHRKELASVPSTEYLDSLQERLARITALESQWCDSRQEGSSYQDAAENLAAEERQLHAELHQALVAAGTCPTCGQPVSALWAYASIAARKQLRLTMAGSFTGARGSMRAATLTCGRTGHYRVSACRPWSTRTGTWLRMREPWRTLRDIAAWVVASSIVYIILSLAFYGTVKWW